MQRVSDHLQATPFSIAKQMQKLALELNKIIKISHPSNSQTRLQPPIKLGKSTSVVQ